MTHEIVEALPFPALLVSEDGRIETGNPGARHIFGNEIRNRSFVTVLRQPSLLASVEAALKESRSSQCRFTTTEAGADITLVANCIALSSGRVLLVLEDRTLSEGAGRQRRDFVANVSHELRTPITALLGFIDTLLGPAKDDPEARERFLKIMSREAERMSRLVSELLSLEQVEAKERVRPTKKIDLAEIVRTVLKTLGPMAQKFGVDVQTDDLGTEAVLPGDYDQINQVVTNLVENAIKYSGRDSQVTVRLRFESINRQIMRSAWLLDVEDTGEGFDPVHIPRLTERFYRVDSHRSREMGGTGLGLAIVKHIINRHRGRLRIESEQGHGSRFTVILPSDT